MPSKDKNPNRRNGKAAKKNPGVSAKAATGRTEGGYSLLAQARRATKRATHV